MSEADRLRQPEPLYCEQIALFLDLDGTLAAFAPRPQDVGPDASRNRLIRDLARALDGRLAIISGRPLADIDRILEGAAAAAAGVHGLERRRADGVVIGADPSPMIPTAHDALDRLCQAWPGALVENKGLSVAAHFRGAPEAAEAMTKAAMGLAADHGLVLQLGDMVVELRTPGFDKGHALAAYMSETPFAGTMPIFVGDDLTDEAAFVAASQLGGFGVLVGPKRPSAASWGLADVPAVLSWLGAAAMRSAA